ncbi:EAL domain-containing protein [Marinobacter sp.]|uniref:EAL domain-containing protein n=1 Tax=Marinobacter sp. TaxID=50741 RepID=UPI003850750C
MHQILLFLALLAPLITASSGAHAENTDPGWSRPAVDFIRSPAGQELALADVLDSNRWESLPDSSPNFGYVTDTFWFRIKVKGSASRRILEVSYPHLDDIRFFIFRNTRLQNQVLTGDRRSFEQRPLQHPNFLVPLEAGEENIEVFIRVSTSGALQVPIRIWHQDAFFAHASVEDQLHAIYYGILITVIFFNLFIFLALRERTYLYYVLSTLGYLFLISTLRGITYPLLWPESPWLHNKAMLLSVPLTMVFALLFARNFLKIPSGSRRLDWLMQSVLAVNMAAIAGVFLLGYDTSIRLSVALAIPTCLLLTVVGPVQWWRGNRQAGLYTLAWTLLTAGSALTAANKYGLVPTSFTTVYAMQIGSALEAILLTIALAARLYQDREDRVAAREAELRAMAARRRAELRMMEQTLHHPLTGLPNRSSFEMLVQDHLNREYNRRHAVGLIQLKNLPTITRTLGHHNTDRLLKLVASRFNSIVRELPGMKVVELSERQQFHLASLESATFAFLMDADVARQFPERIALSLEQLKEPLDYLGMQLPLDPLTGVAIYPDHAGDTDALIRRAYIAQESDEARDRGLAYYESMRDSYSADRLTLVTELKQALADNQLTLFFQPKISLKSREIVGMEALIRWPGRDHSLTADQIIAVAEQTGLIKPLTRWVLENGLAARDCFLEYGYDFSISVNVSPNNLREPGFPLFVQRLMTSHCRHRGRIILEVTETSMMLDPVNSLKALQSLEAAGIPLSIDDFGSGYSSLSYIKQLPAKEIKIDRSLITDLALQEEDRVIVQTTIDMCQSLGYQVVAEGVEDEATANVLEAMGCDMIQGYVLTPPGSLTSILDWLAERGRQTSRGTG